MFKKWLFGGKKDDLEINPYSPDFFKKLMGKYGDQIIMPYKTCDELFIALKEIFSLKPINYEETIVEMRGFMRAENVTKETCDAYLLERNDSSEVFYREHTAKFLPGSKIFLLVDNNNGKIICNDDFLQMKIDILRGINKEEIDNWTSKLKNYLNLFYLYDSELKNYGLQK